MRPALASVHSAAMIVLLLAPVAGAPATEVRVIYRCQADGVTTFSDRPCDANAIPYEADDSRISSYAPGDTVAKPAPADAAGAGKVRQKRAGAADPGKKAVRKSKACGQVNSALREVAQKMRSGYGVREGERLRARKSELEGRRRQMHCR